MIKGSALFVGTAQSMLALCLVCGCNREPVTPRTGSGGRIETPLDVTAIHPSVGTITRNVSLPGTILPNQQATLFAKVAGYLQKITVDKGDLVKERDLIAS